MRFLILSLSLFHLILTLIRPNVTFIIILPLSINKALSNAYTNFYETRKEMPISLMVPSKEKAIILKYC